MYVFLIFYFILHKHSHYTKSYTYLQAYEYNFATINIIITIKYNVRRFKTCIVHSRVAAELVESFELVKNVLEDLSACYTEHCVELRRRVLVANVKKLKYSQ